MSWYLGAALASGAYGALSGLLVPALIAWIPEPAPRVEASAHADDESGHAATPVPERAVKQPYAEIARSPGLRWRTALATLVAAGLCGSRVGFGPELALVLYLAPIGVALAVVDWRTRLLPTKVIAPSYAVVIAIVVVAGVLSHDYDDLIRAGYGWLVAGGTFFVLWFVYPKGMGYGDVRLAGVLGIALGYLGWAELLTGVYAGFLLGGVGGLLLSMLRLVDRKAYPFGPFMLVGAVVGVLAGPWVAAWYS
ncbi:MAG TPA: A24 family peptidase [Nocardioidaceae bacterium]|nr:A24 family peptidase [Nocardioidaceae bacterium]